MNATLHTIMPAAQHAPKSVLIVEDEAPLANALRDKFARAQYQVAVEGNGIDGLRAALAEHPSLLIVDLNMPKMNGMDLMAALRKDPWGKDVPVIILTNFSADSGELVRGVIAVKPAYYLVKSDWDLDEIVEKANTVTR